MSSKSKGEQKLDEQLMDAGLPKACHEYRWAAHLVGLGRGVRQRLAEAGLQDWRFDFAWPDLLLAAEVEGGVWTQGRHTRGGGYEGDCEKYNSAQERGWTVLRFTTGMVADGRALEMLKRILGRKHGA